MHTENNKIQIEGNENFSLQDINGSTINININKSEDIKLLLEKFSNRIIELPTEIMQVISQKHPQLYKSQKYLNTVPSYNAEELIGRTDFLENIHFKLSNGEPLVLINGIGGIGKTTVAKAYVNIDKYINDYQNIAWVTVLNNTIYDFVSQLQGKKSGFKIFEDIDLKQNLNFLLDALRQLEGNNLLVIDNANNVGEILKLSYQLKTLRWKTLITSRAKPENITIMDIEILPEEQAIDLFYKYYQRERDDSALKDLLKHINHHTLLIELLAKAGNKNPNLTIKAIFDLIKNEDIKAIELQRKINLGEHAVFKEDEYENRLFQYILSVFELENLSENEIMYLRYFSFMPPIETTEKQLKGLFQVKEEDELDFIDILDNLVKKGWLIQSNYLYKMHPLINKVLFQRLKPNGTNCKNILNYLKQFNLSFELISFLPLAIHISKLSIDKSILYEINHKISAFLSYMKDFELALQYAEKSYQIIKKNEKKEHKLSRTFNNLSRIHLGLKNNNEALEFSRLAISFHQKYNQNDAKRLLDYYLNMVNVLVAQNMYDEAKTYAKKAMELVLEKFPEAEIHLVRVYNSTARMHAKLKQYKQAISNFKEAINVGEKIFKEMHPLLSSSYKGIAQIFYHEKEFEKAKMFIEKAANYRMKIYPAKHPDLTETLEWQKKIEQAIRKNDNKKKTK